MDDVERAESHLLTAFQRGDLTEVAEWLRDDFLITTAGWITEPVGKATWLAEIATRATLDTFSFDVIASRRFGDTAVVLAKSHQSGTHDGDPYSMTFRYTDVWMLENDAWRLAVRHASAVPPSS